MKELSWLVPGASFVSNYRNDNVQWLITSVVFNDSMSEAKIGYLLWSNNAVEMQLISYDIETLKGFFLEPEFVRIG